MKKLIKLCLATAGIMLAVGIVLHVTGAAMGGRAESNSFFAQRWEKLSVRCDGFFDHWRGIGGILGETQTKDSGAITAPITAIDVDVDCGDVLLRQGDCFSVSMAWNLQGFTLDYEIENGVLKVDSESRSGFLNGVSGMKNEVTITAPAGCTLKSMDLSTNLGDIEVDAAITVTEADLSTALGDVEYEGIWAGELTAETDLGDVDIHLPGSGGDYLWKLETAMGELRVKGERMSGDTVGAAIRGGTGKNRVNASSSLGDVSLDFAGRDSTDYPCHSEHGYIHYY